MLYLDYSHQINNIFDLTPMTYIPIPIPVNEKNAILYLDENKAIADWSKGSSI